MTQPRLVLVCENTKTNTRYTVLDQLLWNHLGLHLESRPIQAINVRLSKAGWCIDAAAQFHIVRENRHRRLGQENPSDYHMLARDTKGISRGYLR